ncbi:wax ester synthase/diacylglycerol acyltransferase 11-like isoform X2 [Corylus avellana]|uniref:wax ester synthase/diacylglycerol acyltransferase 11-like isoform X2 n=1 Tax=Corylus avellana TaxID=13451 RepID=UPI00286A22AE|nr:wax ester synthase/diacylglycerol acyltransferase 11-like isoform X2 [Corylus avellana]
MALNEGSEPVSPSGQYLNSSVLSISILTVLESEVPINDAHAISLLNHVFLPINPRFSSVMVTNQKGDKQWKRVEVKLEDHVNVPIFPAGLSPTSYDEYLDDYMSKIAMDQFPQSKPLWEIHIFKYTTSNAAERADNPSIPLTLPSRPRSEPKSENKSAFARALQTFSSVSNTLFDFGWSVLKSTLVEDDRTPIRSGDEGVEYRPITISTMTFSLDRIKHIKNKLGMTTNDVISGIIFLGTRLCMQEISNESSEAHSTALVLLNTRMISSYKSIKEMVEPNSEAPWGNRFGFLHVPIPKFKDPKSLDPLEFVREAHKIIKRKRSSLDVYLTGRLLEIMKNIRGPEAVARHIHRTLRNSSVTVTNVVGPIEKMALANHPVKGIYYMTIGVPQSLTVSIINYMGNLRVTAGIEKGFLEPQKFKSCMKNAFEMMLKAVDELPLRKTLI